MLATFEPYACSAGLVIAHEAGAYVVTTADGRVVGFPANGEPSPAAVENDLTHPPAPTPAPVVVSPLEMIQRLTDAEKVAIFTSEDPGVIVFRNMAIAAREIRSDDARTLDGLAYLVAIGILSASRPAQLLAP